MSEILGYHELGAAQAKYNEVQEERERPDSIWLSLSADKCELEDTGLFDWDDMEKVNGDFGDLKSVIISGIPLYPDTEISLSSASRYVFNQIEIFQKTKENKDLLSKIGFQHGIE